MVDSNILPFDDYPVKLNSSPEWATPFAATASSSISSSDTMRRHLREKRLSRCMWDISCWANKISQRVYDWNSLGHPPADALLEVARDTYQAEGHGYLAVPWMTVLLAEIWSNARDSACEAFTAEDWSIFGELDKIEATVTSEGEDGVAFILKVLHVWQTLPGSWLPSRSPKLQRLIDKHYRTAYSAAYKVARNPEKARELVRQRYTSSPFKLTAAEWSDVIAS